MWSEVWVFYFQSQCKGTKPCRLRYEFPRFIFKVMIIIVTINGSEHHVFRHVTWWDVTGWVMSVGFLKLTIATTCVIKIGMTSFYIHSGQEIIVQRFKSQNVFGKPITISVIPASSFRSECRENLNVLVFSVDEEVGIRILRWLIKIPIAFGLLEFALFWMLIGGFVIFIRD